MVWEQVMEKRWGAVHHLLHVAANPIERQIVSHLIQQLFTLQQGARRIWQLPDWFLSRCSS